VVMSVNPVAFAARSFRPRQGARCFRTRTRAYPASGSVRSEQRRLGRKEPPPGGLRRIWPGASLLVGHSPTAGGCSLLAPRHRPNWAQRTSSYLCLKPLSRFSGLPASFPKGKRLKPLFRIGALTTRLKPGANERTLPLQESEMRPLAPESRQKS